MSRTRLVPINQTTITPLVEGITGMKEYIVFQNNVPISRKLVMDKGLEKEVSDIDMQTEVRRLNKSETIPIDTYNLSKFNYLGLASGLIVEKKEVAENILETNPNLKSLISKLFENPLSAFVVIGNTGELLILI